MDRESADSIAWEFMRLEDEARYGRERGNHAYATAMDQQAAGMSFVLNRLDNSRDVWYAIQEARRNTERNYRRG